MAFVKLASAADLSAPGQASEFVCGSKTICVANIGGSISALDNICPHRGGPLAQGFIEGDKITCPWHGWQFNAATGQVGHNPNARTNVYPIKVEGDDVL